jgi:hypothetical protein
MQKHTQVEINQKYEHIEGKAGHPHKCTTFFSLSITRSLTQNTHTHVRVYVTDPYKPVELIDILYNLVTYSVHFFGKKIFIYRQKTYI